MALPNIVPTGYALTTNDFLHTKVGRDGTIRSVRGSVSVSNGTLTATVIGLCPFNKGASLNYGSRIYAADLDTASAVTLDIGYTYQDAVTYTNVQDAFVSASTAAQAGGMIEMTSLAGMTWSAAADGWIVATVRAASTGATGSLTFNLGIAYDTSGVTNT